MKPERAANIKYGVWGRIDGEGLALVVTRQSRKAKAARRDEYRGLQGYSTTGGENSTGWLNEKGGRDYPPDLNGLCTGQRLATGAPRTMIGARKLSRLLLLVPLGCPEYVDWRYF